VTGAAAQPMPVRISAWAIYDVFETADEGEQLFVGVVSDGQWKVFCKEFGLDDFAQNEAWAENNERVKARDQIIPRIQQLFKSQPRAALVAKLEKCGLPFAPIVRPDELVDDPHLNAAGGLVDLHLSDGTQVRLPSLPLEFDGKRPGVLHDLPAIDEHGDAIRAGLAGRAR
jgi:crotonobetainyl-CoA:carnitine CoA-transferase CaiB-like acyl-CoA transferase